MNDLQPVVLGCTVAVVAILAVRWYTDPLRAIPTLGGSSLPGLSYIAALRNLRDLRAVLEEGYRKYPESAFRFSTFDRWVVVVQGRDMVEDIRKRPDDELSSRAGIVAEALQSPYFLHREALSVPLHVDFVREKLVKMDPRMLAAVIDEVILAVNDHVPAGENDWTGVEVKPALQKIIARASSRAFVGLPLCRNEEYLALAVDFTANVLKGSFAVRFVPSFMKALIAPFFNKLTHNTNRVVPHLRPIVENRMKTLEESDDDKPIDFLQFMLDRTTSKGEAIFVIAQRLLVLSFGAIYTSSITITQALYHLVEDPELLQALRKEIEAITSSDGWTSTSMGKMWKLDSVLRETLRYHGVGLFAMPRKAMKDVTLRDGTRIPKGTMVNVNLYAQHRHDTTLENARKFDPFRYERMRHAEGQGKKSQFTSTSPDYLPFGHGYHACPGRYFASNELKVILGHIILNYDLKLGGDGSYPPDVYFGAAVIPAPHGHVLFKKRERSG